ncbi:putative ubiquitin-conjugating enzyme [Diaporthe ampelina]|uniref:Putative ubiquitin-conjugating enzyme n=1 Tax=Diaporthe ampelina TaxID=1214573 RepID=A0A0G2F6W3_9PEZI|nr:putative ubiquitin-conjugating enzyme [Diaporthe ampelina]
MSQLHCCAAFMSLKRFNADVRAVRTRIEDDEISGVVAIERGDSDGEVVVTVAHEKLPGLLPIGLLAQNFDNYPNDNGFLIFTASENAATSVVSALEDLRDYTSGMKLLETIMALSTRLDRALRSVDGDEDIIMEDPHDPHGFDDSMEDDPYDDFTDLEFGLSPMRTKSQHRPNSRLASGILRRIKPDLRVARDVGCKIGVLDGLQLSSASSIFSLSIRASELCLSQEALEAWDVEISDYIILLVRFEGLYPFAEQLLEQPCANFNVDFRFGKGAKYKPSPAQARAAFLTEASRNHDAPEAKSQTLKDHQGRTFEKIFISNSLEQFLNEQCLSMIKLRLQNPAYSWDDANEHLRNMSSRAWDDQPPAKANSDREAAKSEPKSTTKTRSTRKSKGKQKATTAAGASKAEEEPPSPKPIPNFLVWDAAASRPLEQCSVPLIIMQFAVHYFSRCTEYCLRCHQHIGTEFEALKPFVCSNPLCLFQYLAMGFGPSIEHEILTQPYVVDLLVSLCYSSVQFPKANYMGTFDQGSPQYRIREFPCGLHLKVPDPYNVVVSTTIAASNTDTAATSAVTAAANEVTTAPTTFIKVLADLRNGALTVPINDLGRVASDTWVMLREGIRPTYGEPAYYHVRVKYIDHQTGTLEVDVNALEPLRAPGAVEMDLLLYDTEFDDLDNKGKAESMITILRSLPPISSLREYLIKNPHSRLRSYAGIPPAAVTLLEWIVASNRSCILQVTPVEDPHVRDRNLLESIKTRGQEAIPSLEDSVQFRFAQGAPDKELRFRRALREVNPQNSKYPTIFAWHGSALSNWHSILRYGLDFKHVMNGRAFGDGVYFSQHYSTSQGFTNPDATNPWPNSALNISSVISLCEIVNAPERFVATSPHLVVRQVDWIQCRYLFARRSPSQARIPPQAFAFPSDPARTVLGPDDNALLIPLKAVSTRKQQMPKAPSSSKRAHETTSSLGETDEEQVSDLEFLFDEDDSSTPPAKRANSARDSSVDSATARQVTTQRPLTPPQTDFRPGTLDLASLPRLSLPSWADGNSAKRLAGDIKHMQKVQSSTPPHELGWYIDFDSMENMFQWIVEFHSFDLELPLAREMKKAGVTSIVLEVRFGRDYPFSPPFVRVIRPRFLPFSSGGGGHITTGGAICMELLTASGWSPGSTMEAVFVSIRTAMSETERPAHLQTTETSARMFDYGANEALEAYVRFAGVHGWVVPEDLRETATQGGRPG